MKRPLSILCLEDKIVQQAVATVLKAIYEEDFLGFSYGFRPERGQHDALDALHVGILRKRVNWVLDADIRAFFDAMAHSWIVNSLPTVTPFSRPIATPAERIDLST